MADRMTSPSEAQELGFAINEMVDHLERRGFSRGQVGAAMTGIGAALVHIHSGHENATGVLDMARDCLTADVSGFQ